MVKYNVNADKDKDIKPPNIFEAARSDDPNELYRAIEDGQSLDDVENSTSRMTPLHLGCLLHSERFLEAALALEFDPWIRDSAGRLAIDHARAQGLRVVQRDLVEKMYPPGFDIDPVVKL